MTLRYLFLHILWVSFVNSAPSKTFSVCESLKLLKPFPPSKSIHLAVNLLEEIKFPPLKCALPKDICPITCITYNEIVNYNGFKLSIIRHLQHFSSLSLKFWYGICPKYFHLITPSSIQLLIHKPQNSLLHGLLIILNNIWLIKQRIIFSTTIEYVKYSSTLLYQLMRDVR